MNVKIIETELALLAEIVAERTGLHFSSERLPDLERGLCSAAADLGYSDIKSCVEWLLSGSISRDHIETLADHLTIGETYFFRDKALFNLLKYHVLPELIESRRKTSRFLRIWSAGCCTGEEPYTIAIILHEMIPDIAEWNISLVATDINKRFLCKAVEGIYTGWSFRETMPDLQKRYFHEEENGRFRLIPAIREMVEFSFLNLAENIYPSVLNNTNAMDIIFCRNVLMYFTPEQAANVVQRFYLSITENGWLAVSPSETSQVLFSRFKPINKDGTIFYKKSRSNVPDKKIQFPEPAVQNRKWPQAEPFHKSPTADTISEPFIQAFNPQPAALVTPEETVTSESEAALRTKEPHVLLTEAEALYNRGFYEECVKKLMSLTLQGSDGIKAMALMARAYANLGRLDDARRWCEKAVAEDKLNAENYYLLAAILLEQEETISAVRALYRALYADQKFALAHFTLGNILKSQGKLNESRKYFRNALYILSALKPEEILPGSDGMTAGRLTEIINIFNLKVTA